MAYSGASVDEAMHKMMVGYLDPIHKLVFYLGAPANPGKWKRRSDEDYGWTVEGQRDTVVFAKPQAVKVHRVLGEPVVLERTPGSAVLAEVQNGSHHPLTREISYSRTKTKQRTSIDSMTHGWSFDSTTTIGAEVTAGEEGIGSVKASIEQSISVGAHGEYTSGTEMVDATEESIEDEIEIQIDPGTISRILQTTDKANIKVPFVDKDVYDIGAEYIDWADTTNVHQGNWRFLPIGKKKWKGKLHYYRLLSWANLEELRAKISGQHKYYPRSALRVPGVEQWYKWLEKEDNRTVEYHGEAVYNEASATNVLVDERSIT